MARPIRVALAFLLLATPAAAALAQTIYTCTDSKGRRLTADRPIIDCLDREQKMLSPSATVQGKLGPSLTAAERAAEEDKAREALEERGRIAEEKRRERALLVRYPHKGVHDKERAAALIQVEEVIAAATKRTAQLLDQRKALDVEVEFFKNDPARLPVQLKRQLEENQQQQAVQTRYLADQTGEKQRVNARFDEELWRLNQLWAVHGTRVSTTPAATPAARKQ